MTGSVLEGTPIGFSMLRALDRATRLVRDNIETIFRAACAFFFIAIWGAGGILLTPELKTESVVVGAIQLGIAAGMLSRRTMPLSALGIFVLFGIGVWEYGPFHLADYPIFLGVAAYLALVGGQTRFFRRASDRRVALGRRHHPDVGVDREMGLSGMVVSAVHPAFGNDHGLCAGFLHAGRRRGRICPGLRAGLDAAGASRRRGHAGGDVRERGVRIRQDRLDRPLADRGRVARHHCRRRRPRRRGLRDSWLLPFGYAASLAVFLAAYYAGHAALFGTAIL